MSDTRTLITVSDTGAVSNRSTPMPGFDSAQRPASAKRTQPKDERVIRLKRAVTGGDYRVNAWRIALKLTKRD